VAKDVYPLRAVWLLNGLPMLPLGGKHIGTGKGWEGWSLSVDYSRREVIITPPRNNKCGKMRVPLEWGVCYQLGTSTVKGDE